MEWANLAFITLVLIYAVGIHINLKEKLAEHEKDSRNDKNRFLEENQRLNIRINTIESAEFGKKMLPFAEEYIKLKYPNKRVEVLQNSERFEILQKGAAYSMESFYFREAPQKLEELKKLIETVCCKKGKK